MLFRVGAAAAAAAAENARHALGRVRVLAPAPAQQKEQKQKAQQKRPLLLRRQPRGGGGDDAKKGHLLLLHAAAAAAALEARAERSDALDKAAEWRDLRALLPTRAKTVRRAAGRRKQQQQLPKDVVAGGKQGSAHRGGRPSTWSAGELRLLLVAVRRHGRDWAAVASSVGSKSRQQCIIKVNVEVAAGRMQEPAGKQVRDSWSKVELGALKRAVALHARDWDAVACSVRSKTRQQCFRKVAKEVAAGRMQEPGGKQLKESWRKVELGALKRAVALHGRDWGVLQRVPVNPH